jgi:hypothetical protein
LEATGGGGSLAAEESHRREVGADLPCEDISDDDSDADDADEWDYSGKDLDGDLDGDFIVPEEESGENEQKVCPSLLLSFSPSLLLSFFASLLISLSLLEERRAKKRSKRYVLISLSPSLLLSFSPSLLLCFSPSLVISF